jgi:hypothetical protein
MVTTTVQTHDLAQAIADVLDGVVRCYWYVSDLVRPPAVVIALPSVDYEDTLSGFCSATWVFPLTLVVSRNGDRETQVALSRTLQEITTALGSAVVPGVYTLEPISARPATVTVSGQELPGYNIQVRIRA